MADTDVLPLPLTDEEDFFSDLGSIFFSGVIAYMPPLSFNFVNAVLLGCDEIDWCIARLQENCTADSFSFRNYLKCMQLKKLNSSDVAT